MQLPVCLYFFRGQPPRCVVRVNLRTPGTFLYLPSALIDRLAAILPVDCLLIADVEHFTMQLLKHLSGYKKFSFLIPRSKIKNMLQKLPAMTFTPMWAGYAVGEGNYQPSAAHQVMRQIVQRTGETKADYAYKAFVTNSQMPAARKRFIKN